MAAINQIKVRRQERAKAFSAALERLLEPFDIGQLFVLAGQEVKGGAIMPDVI